MTDLIPRDPGAATLHFTNEQTDLIRRVIAPQITDDDFQLFMTIAARSGLDPMARQIYAIPRKKRVQVEKGRWEDRTEMTIQTGIDGYRAIAQRSGQYTGSGAAEWCGPDGLWRDVWLSEEPPAAARVTVYRNGEPFTHVATYREFVQMVDIYEGSGDNRKKKGREPNSMWTNMPANQLAKCAEAGALRKAFPVELGGVFVDAEEAGIQYVVAVEAQRNDRPAPRQIQQPRAKSAPKAPRPQPEEKPFGTDDDEPPIEGQTQELPPEAPAPTGEAPWGTFWNALREATEGTSLQEIGAALGIEPTLKSLQGWYAGNGASLELVDFVVDTVAASKGQ